MSMVPLFWNPETVPAELHELLNTLAEAYPVSTRKADGAMALRFVKCDCPGVSRVAAKDGAVEITYSTVAGAARGIGTALAGVEADNRSEFTTLGIMLDCSRNAVMRVDYVKKWLREIALMGYNRAMLYTEDTYQLPDEPYFGYMRGAYSEAELLELDAYAARLGIELIGCIQTLGHLEQMMRWATYTQRVRDTASVMEVDNPATYALIEKMIAACAKCFRSRTLHIGMDETHDLGRGRRMDKRGYESGFTLFNRHLEKVGEICRKYGLKPMIWSDMYFRLGNPAMDYYAKDTVIPEEVKQTIPADADLVYWDYYHVDEEFYTDWIQRHRDLGKEPLLGSGIWSWARFWYDHQLTTTTVRPALAAARKAKLAHVFFTMWGDDGATCEYDSIMAGLAYAADLSWGEDPDADATAVSARLRAIADEDYASCVAFSEMEYPGTGDIVNNWEKHIGGHTLLWDDLLLGIFFTDAEATQPGWLKDALAIFDRLASWPEANASEPVRHARQLAKTTAAKLRFRRDLVQAYFNGDKRALGALADMEAPELKKQMILARDSFRKQWMRRNKPFGWEVIAMRMNAQIGRVDEAALRIHEYLKGVTPDIAELEESRKITPDCPRSGTYNSRDVIAGTTLQ